MPESLNFLANKEEILIDIGIDGLRLFKSSNRVLWPILGSLSDFPHISPFVIGCFSGLSKPKNINDFMRDFCTGTKSLKENGIKVGFHGSFKTI